MGAIYYKGVRYGGGTPEDGVTGTGTSGQVAKFNSEHGIVGANLTTSDISNFPSSMPASDVSDWAKASTKPSYDADEVGAVSTTANQGLTTTEQANARDNIGLGSASVKDVPTSGNASTTQVVMGDDTRLSDARQASDVYSWAKAENKPSYTASEVGAIATTAKGTANGVAELDANGLVPSAQLPSFVDDVLEYSSESLFPETGETGKIYVDTTTNKTYRWSGTTYVAIGSDLALGETSSTAYRGDRGKDAYDHSQLTSGNPHNVTKSDVGLGNVGNFKAVSTEENQGLTSTEQSNARANIGAGTSDFDGAYSSLSGAPTLGTASAKDVVSSIDTSNDIPTSNAVKDYVDTQVSTYISNVVNTEY